MYKLLIDTTRKIRRGRIVCKLRNKLSLARESPDESSHTGVHHRRSNNKRARSRIILYTADARAFNSNAARIYSNSNPLIKIRERVERVFITSARADKGTTITQRIGRE